MTDAWTLILLLWLSTIFGGEGMEGRPLEVTVTFPTQAGCAAMVKALVRHTKHEIVRMCPGVEVPASTPALTPAPIVVVPPAESVESSP